MNFAFPEYHRRGIPGSTHSACSCSPRRGTWWYLRRKALGCESGKLRRGLQQRREGILPRLAHERASPWAGDSRASQLLPRQALRSLSDAPRSCRRHRLVQADRAQRTRSRFRYESSLPRRPFCPAASVSLVVGTAAVKDRLSGVFPDAGLEPAGFLVEEDLLATFDGFVDFAAGGGLSRSSDCTGVGWPVAGPSTVNEASSK